MICTTKLRVLEQIDFEEKKAALDKENQESRLNTETLAKFQALYDQCVTSCSSPIPLKISQAFKVIDHKFVIFMHARNAWDMSYAEFSDGAWWEVNLPSPKISVEKVEKRLEKEWKKLKED